MNGRKASLAQASAFSILLLLLLLLILQDACSASRDRYFIGPESGMASVDSVVEFKCRLLGVTPKDKVVWFSNGLPLGRPNPPKDAHGYSQFVNRPRFKAYEDLQSGEFRLQIFPLKFNDTGTVQCQALATEASSHISSEQANLTVLVPPRDAEMRIQVRGSNFETRSDYNLRSNVSFLVKCEVGPSYPSPTVVWKIGQVHLEHARNSVFIRTSSHKRGQRESSVDSMLTFVAEPWMDGKHLTCAVSHPALNHTIDRSALVTVSYIPFVNITLFPDEPLRREFSSLTATCNVLARPEYSRIRWYIGGRQVENASTDTLQVASLSRHHHNSQIQCGAENSIGISYASVDVAVTYGPRFTSKERPEDVWVDPREQVTLTCNDIDSNPPATVHWLRRSDVIFGDATTETGGDDWGYHGNGDEESVGEGTTLTFRASDLKAFGVYACVATTPGFDTVRREFLVGKKGRPVVLGPKEQAATAGRIGSLTCLVRGIPRPSKITWYKNNELIDFDKELRYSSKERDVRHGRVSTIEILDAVESDFTIFNCSAYSSHGFDSQLIVLRKKEVVPFYCWVATAVAGVVMMMILVASFVCCKYWKKMPGSVVCCEKNKKLPSSDGSASTSQTSSDSMDLKRMCNLPDISIQHQQNKNYGIAYSKQSPTFDSLEQKQKLLQVVGEAANDKSYTRFESPNHHAYQHNNQHNNNYHPNGPPYPCDSPDCQSGADEFIADRYGTCASRAFQERESFLHPYTKTCMQDCKGSTAFKAYSKLATGNLYGPTPVTSVGRMAEVEDGEEDYADDIRRSQYLPGLCLVPPLSLNRQYYQQPMGHGPPLQYSPSSGGSGYPPRGLAPRQPPSNSSYSSPSPTDSKLSTNV